jgi:hypothetical protein
MLEHESQDEQLPPNMDEVEKAIKRLNNRTPGPNNIPGELFKKGGKELLNRMHAVMTNTWEVEEMPKDSRIQRQYFPFI